VAVAALAGLSLRAAFVDQTAARLPVDSGGLYAALGCDVDGDHDTDLVLATQTGLRLLLNGGTGTFADATAARLPALTGAFLTVAAADVDADGDADLFAAGADGISRLLLNSGTGTFADATAARLPPATRIATGAAFVDVDADGDLDLVVACRDDADRLLLNDGLGTFSDASAGRLPGDAGATSAVLAADLDGDGRPDLVFTREDGSPRLLLNAGLGTFSDASAASLPAGLPGALGLGVADVDSDGDLDLVLAGGSAGVGLLRNDGTGHFAAVAPTATALPPLHAVAVAVADLNEDGLPDVAVACAGQDRVLLNTGGGLFVDDTAAQIPADTERTFGVLAVDVDGDLDLDLLLARPEHQTRLLTNPIAIPRVRVTALPALVEAGQTVAIHAEAFDEDGIASLTVTVNGTPVALAAGSATYVPAAAGPYTVVATATDALANPGTRQTTFRAVDNVAPVVLAGPDATAFRGQAFTGSGAFTDPGEDTWTGTVDYGDGSGAQPLALTPTKTFQLNHTYNAFGTFTVTVSVNDGDDTGTDALTVTVANQPPVVSPIPPQVVQSPLPFAALNLDEYVTDPDHADNEIIWGVTGNTLLAVTISSGRIATLTYPAEVTAAAETLTFTATDPEGGQDATAVLMVVTQNTTDFLRPVVTLTATPEAANAGSTIQLAMGVTDESDILLRELKVNGQTIPLDAAGHASFSSPTPGLFTAVASAMDAAGNRGEASLELRFLVPGDTIPPTLAIVDPADGDEVAAAIDILGTAADTNLTRYTLAYSVKDRNEFQGFATGTASVTDGVLGQLDTSLMENGIYDLRLAAEDSAGNTAWTQVAIQVAAQLKVGAVSLVFRDMKIPVSGIPLMINRRYDSRDKGKGDFGYGWRLDANSVKLTLSGALSEGWDQLRTGSFIPTWQLVPSAAHYAMVDYPDGSWEAFYMSLSPTLSQLFNFVGLDINVSFSAYPGTFSTLTPLGYNVVTVLEDEIGPVTLYATDDYDIYQPERFRLTTREGGQIVLTANGGVESITDAAGNVTTFTPTGITHSSGRGLQIQRDEEDRITQISDPVGNTVRYTYDAYGDLVAVTNQLGDTTRFVYDREHNLIDMVTPDGVRGIRNQYDDEGRIIGSTAPDGTRISFTRDATGHTEVLADAAGKLHTTRYDNQGNITSVTDPLGRTSTFTYDADGNRLSATDPLGNTTSYTYDARGNMLTATLPDGSQSVSTYDDRNSVTSIRDPGGNATHMTYDAQGNLLTITNPLGEVRATYTYDSAGRMTSSADGLGNTYAFAYTATGDLAQVTDPLGHQTTFTYDANGNRLSKAQQRTLGDGTTVTELARFEYDGLNRPVALVDAAGQRTEMAYTSTGEIGQVIVPGGRTYSTDFSLRGFAERSTFPDGTEQRFTYDPRGYVASMTDRDGTVTTQEYDDAGNLIRKTLPDGRSVSYLYDAAARLVGQTDSVGSTMSAVLDANSRVTQKLDALGNATALAYDASSRLTGTTDPMGRQTALAYDAAGRITTRTSPGGGSQSCAYDAAGRYTGGTNERGALMQYAYDATGQLAQVTEPLGAPTAYAYDEVGNRVTVTDALGNTTRHEYDANRRRVRRQLPLGQFETWTYDAAGHLASHGDLNGDVTTYAYDDDGRVVTVHYADGSEELYTYTPTGNLATYTDAGGTSSFGYDAVGRLRRQTDPFGQVLTYTYDTAGRIETVSSPAGTTRYAFDIAGRLVSVTDPGNRTYTYTRNAAGQVTQVDYPNGTRTLVTYNGRGLRARVEHQAPDHTVLKSYDYTYDAAGNRTRVVENDGRQVDYTYDLQNRLTSEVITPAGGGATRTIAYTYDAVGNRLTRDDAGTVNTYTYDDNNRLLSDGTTTYTYDNAGRLLTRTAAGTSWTHSYNGRDQLVRAVRDAGGTVTTLDLVYHQGDRIATLVNGVEVRREMADSTIGFTEKVAELDSGGSLLAYSVFGDDLLSRTAGGATVCYHPDGAAGSVGLLTNAAGQAVATYTYDAFGRLLASTGAADNPHRFAGERLDADLGLYDLRARLYDPENGRFLTPDPIEGIDSDPSTQNPYVYTRNNPVNSTDPSGKFDWNLPSVLTAMAITTTVISISNSVLAITGCHPFLIGKSRHETKDETLPDGGEGEIGFGGEWLRLYSEVDFSLGPGCLSPKILLSRATGINVGVRHLELEFGFNIRDYKETVEIAKALWKSADVASQLATLRAAMACCTNPPAALVAMASRLDASLLSALSGYGAKLKPKASVGTAIGLAFAHQCYSSKDFEGLNIGGELGGQWAAGPWAWGFDVGGSVNVNIPDLKKNGWAGGLLGPGYELPSVQFTSAWGGVESEFHGVVELTYGWPWKL